MKRRLQKLFYALSNPQCLRGVGMYLSKSKPYHLHRKLALNIHPKLSRSTWYAILTASTICWYFAIFWFQLAHSLHIACKQKQFTFRTISELLYIGLWLGASPYNYFALNLTNAKKSDWIFYIFLEEQISWHHIFNLNSQHAKNIQSDIAMLRDKQAFSQYLLHNELPAIPTLATLTQAMQTDVQLIEQKINHLIKNDTNFFIKPQSSNAMKGCVWVKINQLEKDCNAYGINYDRQFIRIHNKQKLVEFISYSLKHLEKETHLPLNQRNLLLQKNYPSSNQVNNILTTSLPNSLRLISYQPEENSKNIFLIYALLEESIESENNEMLWQTHNINISSGEIRGQKINQWSTIINQVIHAHLLFPSVYTIAWDVILTEQGFKVIEGNFGWDAINPQRVSHSPLLKFFIEAN